MVWRVKVWLLCGLAVRASGHCRTDPLQRDSWHHSAEARSHAASCLQAVPSLLQLAGNKPHGCVNYAITAPNYVYYYYYYSCHFMAIIHASTIKIRLWLYCIQLYMKFELTDAGHHNNRTLHLSCCSSNVSIFQPMCTRKLTTSVSAGESSWSNIT